MRRFNIGKSTAAGTFIHPSGPVQKQVARADSGWCVVRWGWTPWRRASTASTRQKGLCLPCEDYQCDAACTHDQRNMWFFSLFALSDGTRLCEGYSARKEKQFKEGTRMGLPEAPVKGEDRQRTAKDPAPRICKCVRDHMWSRLGQRAVKLDPVPVTLEAMVEKLREALRMAKSATATYPRLELPCGDFKGCECSRGRPMNFFSLFARNGDRVCGTYSRATENKFKVDVRPTFPDPPEKTEQRSTREKAPCLCIHEQGHIWKRLGERPVLLDPVPDTLEGMVEKLREALSEPDAARAGADAARAEADGVQGAALPTATPSAQLAMRKSSWLCSSPRCRRCHPLVGFCNCAGSW